MNTILGKVYLVGAGPGDPELLTLRGAQCLREAHVVLYDYLASAELLAGTRGDAELVCLGHHGHGRLMSQDEINRRMVEAARAGRTVVRLKGGDPAIFARLGEELAALEAAGLPYEIVPGVTAAQAASSHAGIPLTHRDEASCVAFVTGQEMHGKGRDAALDYAALARFPGTLVFYMGVTTATEWSAALIQHGKSPQTPVAIVWHCSLADQQTLFTRLGEVAGLILSKQLRPPAVIIVGEVASERDAANWFTSRPLFGQTVLVTRPQSSGTVPILLSPRGKMGLSPSPRRWWAEQQAQAMIEKLSELGANVLYQPAIEIAAPRDRGPVDAVIGRLDEFDWLVFSSGNGVQYFFERLLELGLDLRALAGAKLAAIGPATVAALAEYHLKADMQPDTYRAEALAEALAPHARGQRFFLARASRGREVLADMLTAAGAKVEQAVVYESRDVVQPNEEIADALAAGRIDWTTVTSSAIARSLVNLFGDTLGNTKLAAISPLTAEVLTELGYPPAVVAEDYTTDGILAAILAAAGHKL
jgi:uroporphyrinogen III methyltransferase/synthase